MSVNEYFNQFLLEHSYIKANSRLEKVVNSFRYLLYLDLIKLLRFCTTKEIINKWYDNLFKAFLCIYLQMILLIRAWFEKYASSSYNSITKTKQHNKKKWAEDLNRHLSKEAIQVANRLMKRCSPSLIIREMQVRTMVNLTLVRMPIIKKSTNNKWWRGCGENGTLPHSLWEHKLV